MILDPLLRRQLRKCGLSDTEVPKDLASWQVFLAHVDRAYTEAETRTESLEHTLAVTALESETRFNQIVHDVPGMIFKLLLRKDDTLSLLYASPAGEAIFERPVKTLLENFGTLLVGAPEHVLPELLRTLREAAAKREPWSFLWSVGLPSGRRKWIEGRAQFGAAEGGELFFDGLILDVTTQKEAEEQLEAERVRRIASARLATLGELAAGIAHEINNPLTAILASADVVAAKVEQDPLDRAELRAAASRIAKTSERIAAIVRGLRAFAREGSKDPFMQAKIRSIVDDTLELCRGRLRHLGIQLRVSPVPEVSLDCRAVQISQVLLNLINNAADAVANLDEKWIRLEVRVLGSSGAILLSVTDSGRGIPVQVAAKLMQPFFTTKAAGKGTGLGLSISKGIVEDHRGTLSVDSSCTHTRFVVQLPIRQAA